MGQILDMVPNHMGVGTNDNAWWNDVLENGPASPLRRLLRHRLAASPRPELRDKVLLPVLGDPTARCWRPASSAWLSTTAPSTSTTTTAAFPSRPRSYGLILGHRLDELEAALGRRRPRVSSSTQSILTAVRNLRRSAETDPTEGRRAAAREGGHQAPPGRPWPPRASRARVHRAERGRFQRHSPATRAASTCWTNCSTHSAYRLSFWRVASDEINYRRFFDINDLAALSMEREEVFEAAHALVLRLVAEGKVDGLRIDHPDGLYDPRQYFRRLQERSRSGRARRASSRRRRRGTTGGREGPAARSDRRGLDSASRRRCAGRSTSSSRRSSGPTEPCHDWPVHGTSGYEFVNQVNGLFVNPDAAHLHPAVYRAGPGRLAVRRAGLSQQAADHASGVRPGQRCGPRLLEDVVRDSPTVV